MSELKPCKCKLCDSEFVPAGAIGEAWKHPRNGCNLSNVYFGNNELDKIRALMDDTPDILRGARIGLEMAAKWHDEQADKLFRDAQDAERSNDYKRARHLSDKAEDHRDAATTIRAIPDADIMKEISRE